jgi:PAS domain S-box-containing protein
MARLTRAFDWAATPLGPVETWTASLRTTVSTLLASRHAMFLWWGPELIQFYNDGYRPSLGPDRHPSALGGRGRDCWAEIWPIIGPEVESIMAGGDASWHDDHLVPITRGDRVYDVYWSYSYSPVRDDDGSVGGVLVTVQETTRRVLAERRARILGDLVARLFPADSPLEICRAAVDSLASAPDDVALARVYLADGATLRLACSAGVESGTAAAPLELGPGDATPRVVPVEPVAFERWREPVGQVLHVPFAGGVLVVGLNPRLPLDGDARQFADRLGHEIAGALDGLDRRAREWAAERDKLAAVFELAPSFMAVLRGPDHVFELANPAYRQLVRHRPVLGRPLREALPEVVGQGIMPLLDEVYRTGEPYVGNEQPIRLAPAPGEAAEPRYLNFVYQPMRSGGRITGILVTGVDVTALVEARRVVERALAELRTVLNQAPLAIAITDPAGEIRFANRTFEQLWGRPAEDARSQAAGEAYRGFHLDGRPIGPDEWAGARAVLQGEVVEGEVIQIVQAGHPGQEGRRLTVWISAAPVRDPDSRIVGGVVVFRDITAERRTEQQLRDAQRLQAVATLAGGVAHEVNNALQATLGFGAFVLRALGPEHPQAPDMRLVLQSAERASRVSQQLLAYTRQQVTQPRPIDLAELTADLRAVLQQLLGADKLLELPPPAEPLPRVLADPAQVERVLINLVANARDAADTGGRVTITVDPVTAGEGDATTADMGFRLAAGDYVRLSVSDTGHGMSRETLSRMFDPFFTTKSVGQGTGLGLSMVYGTVKQHGGYIGARSAVGEGTTIEVFWPTVGDAAAARGAEDAGEGPGDAVGRGRVVLVADDEPLVRALVVRTFELEGYVVHAAPDGQAALRRIEEGVVPDLVVTDVIMPHLNGRQLHDRVRARWPGLPVLYISGHTDDEVVVQRLVPEGAPFLQKPFAPDTLARAAAALLRESALRT